jgi:hypothetical protein
MRTLFVLAAIVIAGCSKAQTKEEAESAKAIQDVRQSAAAASLNITETKAKREALKKDRPAMVQKAIDAMRKDAALSFGTSEAAQADITADESGIKDLGNDLWEVTGLYIGPDKSGAKFKAPWTVHITIWGGEHQCMLVKLGKREAQ